MKKQRLLTLFGSICIILISIALPFMTAHSKPAKPIVLKAVTLLKRGHPINYHEIWIAEQVKKRSNGELVIKIIGGSEAIPAFEQGDRFLLAWEFLHSDSVARSYCFSPFTADTYTGAGARGF